MRYALLAFLTLLNVLNFLDRQLIPSLAPKLIADLGLSRADIGLLYGYVFLVFYTGVGLVLGPAGDRWHRPRLIFSRSDCVEPDDGFPGLGAQLR